MRYWLLMIAVMLAASGIAPAAVYKCTKDGKPVFSDRPCGDDAQQIEVKAAPRSGGNFQSGGDLRWKVSAAVADRAMRRDELERGIAYRKGRIATMQRQMEDEMARLKQEMLWSNNNLAGAVRDESLASQMQAVTTKYQTRIGVEQAEIQRMHQELGSLPGN